MQLAYERKFLSLKPASTYLCAAQEGHHGAENVRDKYLNSSRDRSTLEEATPHPLRLILEKSFESVRESVSRGTRRRSREGQNAEVKNPQSNQERLHWYSTAAIELWVFFGGGLKWRSRRNGKTHQNEIQDSDRPSRRGESLEKIRIYFISLSARIQTLFSPTPAFSHLRARVLSSTTSAGHPFATPFPRPSSVT